MPLIIFLSLLMWYELHSFAHLGSVDVSIFHVDLSDRNITLAANLF